MRPVSLGIFFLLVASAAFAQSPESLPVPPPAPGILTNYRFHLNATSLATADPRFTWETEFGGDIDLVDYGAGRLNFLANYEAVLSEERRAFDPNQGNYTLDFFTTFRVHRTEIGPVFHHVSRHYSDRAKTFGIAWNMWGLQVARTFHVLALQVDTRGRAIWPSGRSFVDYASNQEAIVAASAPLPHHMDAVFLGSLTRFGTVRAIADRGAQSGGRAEVGIRFTHDRAALELFAGVERRVDANAVDRVPLTWAIAGFRFLSR